MKYRTFGENALDLLICIFFTLPAIAYFFISGTANGTNIGIFTLFGAAPMAILAVWSLIIKVRRYTKTFYPVSVFERTLDVVTVLQTLPIAYIVLVMIMRF